MTDSQHFNINDDEPLVDDQETQEEDKRPQANVLLQLAEEAKLFRGPDGTAYADLMVMEERLDRVEKRQDRIDLRRDNQ